MRMNDCEREDSGVKVDPNEVFRQMVDLLDSEQDRAVFVQFPHDERAPLSERVGQLGKKLHRLDRELTVEEKREKRKHLGLVCTYQECLHPEKAIERLCRVGKKLNLSKITPEAEPLLPNSIRKSLEFRRRHIDLHGEQSIVQLGLSDYLTEKLMQGVFIRNDRYELQRFCANTIAELRDLLKISTIIYSGFTTSAGGYRTPMRSGRQIQLKLAAWDAILEEPQNPPISTV